MTRLAKYIKPYLFLLAIAIVLLFIQAYTNLALPDYMSNIVNVGIQQGGVADAVPYAVRKSRMDKLTLFMSASDMKRVLTDYQLVRPGSPESKQYVSHYPVLAKEAVYVRKNIDAAEISVINPVMGKAWLAVSAVERAQSNRTPAKVTGAPAGKGTGIGAVPGTDPFMLLKMLPADRRARLAGMIDKKFSSMGPGMITQAAAEQVKAEYTAIGVNTSGLQTKYMLRTGTIMLLFTLIAAIAAIVTGFISARIASGLARDLRAAVFERVEGFGSGELDKFSTASLITRSTDDIMQIQMVAAVLVTMVFYAPIIGVGGIIRAIGKSSSMWWIIALVVAILMVVVFTVYQVAVPKFKLMQRLMDRLNLVSRETLSGMMVIRAFNMQDRKSVV